VFPVSTHENEICIEQVRWKNICQFLKMTFLEMLKMHLFFVNLSCIFEYLVKIVVFQRID